MQAIAVANDPDVKTIQLVSGNLKCLFIKMKNGITRPPSVPVGAS
jgi:hypothetical protein